VIAIPIKEHSSWKKPGGPQAILKTLWKIRDNVKRVQDGEVSPEELDTLKEEIFKGLGKKIPRDWRFVIPLIKGFVSVGIDSIELNYSNDAQAFVDTLASVIDLVIKDLEK
jgi:hypothetical protein